MWLRLFEGTQLAHFLRGPATLSLAVPLDRKLTQARYAGLAISVAPLAG